MNEIYMDRRKKKYHIRVGLKDYNLYSFYYIDAYDGDNAAREARKKFNDEICGGKRDPLRDLDHFIINNPDIKESLEPYMDEILANI